MAWMWEQTDMVHLQSVRIRGFKTFARQTELLLEPGVTVIIGPNGSGKSNIADAVLWVLGEQSPGSLRGRTMQDVMFTGADGKRQSAAAEVSLVFNNGGGTLPLDCHELEVTRRLTRDEGSEYRLNGSSCRLLDIQDVVGQLGLGREMHSVISQGKVESLLNSSAEARRAMVEEAAGLGRFKKRRERAQSKLERASQNLVRARDIEEEVRAAMRPLRQQVAAAERFAEATEDWAAARGRLLLHSLLEVQEAHNSAGHELEQIDAGLSEVGSRVAELRRQRASEEESFTLALQERERLGSLFHQTRAVAEYLESRTAALRQRLVRAEGDLDRAQRRLDLTRSDATSLASRMAEVMTGTADEARLGRVGEWSETLRKALEDALPAHQQAAQKEDDLKDAVFELETARSRALQDREFLRRERDERGRVKAEVAGLLEQTQARLQQLEIEAAKLKGAVAEAEAAVRSAEAGVQGAAEAREKARGRAQETSGAEAGLAQVLAGLESRQTVLRGVLERKEGLPAGARELLAGSAGYRSLAEVLVVKPGYERAVAAALGATIQAVVVPTGQGLAETLRRASGPVEALAEGADDAEITTKTAAPFGTTDLWEFVSGPEPVMRTLRAIVPETLVVEDAGEADEGLLSLERSGGLGAARLVTRDGELLQPGVFAARRQELGAESLLAATNELAAASKEYDAVCEERIEARRLAEKTATETVEAEALLRQQEESLREAEHHLAGQRSEADLCRRRLEEGGVQLNELRERDLREARLAEELAEQLKTVEEAMAGRESELERARGSLRDLQASLETTRRVVARLEEKKGQAALAEVKLRERCRTLVGERARVQGQKEIADREVSKCQRRVEFLQRCAPVVASLLAVADNLAERGRTAVGALESHVEATRNQTEGTSKSMRDWGSAEIGLQSEYDAMTSRLTEVRIEQARLQDRRGQLEEELAELRRRHLSPRNLAAADIAGAEAQSLAAAVERAERRRERIGPVNPLAEQEYGQMAERAQFLADQSGDLEAAVLQLQEVISSLDEHIERSFAEVFESAKQNFEAVISVVFPGAKGSLRLTDTKPGGRAVADQGEGTVDDLPDDDQGPPTRGVALEVKFANKAPRSLSLLSGGEKAMTAIAFLFSLFLARPCPFYILDEVEASLDDLNIRRFLSLVQKYRDRTQFIIITHQRQTMEVADTLYGVALESDGTSRILSRKMNMAKGA
jgi:chromosome segregation protein